MQDHDDTSSSSSREGFAANTLELGQPSAKIIKRAVTELRETEEIKQKALIELKNLIEDDGSLECPTDDEYLLKFLRPTKFYPDSAHKMVRQYMGHMRKYSEMYSELHPSRLIPVLENNLVSVSPVRDQLGRRITIVRFGAWHPKICTMDDMYRAVVACAELGATEPTTQMTGCVSIIDMAGTSLRHVTNLSPGYAKKTVDWIQGSFPIRFKAFHIVNQPRIFDLVYAFFKPLLGTKLKGRIYFHGSNMSSLHNHVSPACLAQEHGGHLEEYDQAGFLNIVTENKYMFKEIRHYTSQYNQ